MSQRCNLVWEFLFGKVYLGVYHEESVNFGKINWGKCQSYEQVLYRQSHFFAIYNHSYNVYHTIQDIICFSGARMTYIDRGFGECKS